jgi:hypothetical protein
MEIWEKQRLERKEKRVQKKKRGINEAKWRNWTKKCRK